jgi:hypothetical protein
LGQETPANKQNNAMQKQFLKQTLNGGRVRIGIDLGKSKINTMSSAENLNQRIEENGKAVYDEFCEESESDN